MKILTAAIIAMILFAGSSCQQAVDTEKEKEAILAVVKGEADALLANDRDRLLDLYVHEDLTTRLEMGVFGYNRYEGWEEVGALLEDFVADEDRVWDGDAVNRKENVILKVTGNTAWFTCDNIWEWTESGGIDSYNNIQVVFLEKIKGEWKISFSAYYTKPRP